MKQQLKNKRIFCVLVLSFIFSCVLLFVPRTTVVSAATPLHEYSNDTIPSGIAKNNLIDSSDVKRNTIFRPLTYPVLINNGTYMNANTFPNGISNSLATPTNNVLSGNPTNTNTGTFGLWSKNVHQGVIWSNDAYKMDLDKDQYFSFWFWGSDTDPLINATKGGLAFVIQNDPRQQNAFSYDNVNGTITNTKNIKFAPDETLGAFAADQNSPHLGNAIQNSWALSLDMHQNVSGKINDAFDDGVYTGVPSTGSVYISSGYPGEASTYNTGIIGGGYNMPRANYDVGNMSYANGVGMWHHLRILYTAPKAGGNDAEMTYWFNDINEDGSKNTNSGAAAIDTQANPKLLERTYPVDLAKLHVSRNSDGKRLVRWGLVGRDDSGIAKITVALETASPVLNVDITPQVVDVTQDNRVLTPDNEYVNSNDKLIFRYTLNYNSGVSSWSSVKSFITIPKGTILNTADYGSITFGNTTQSILNPSYTDGYFQYSWPDSLNSTNKRAVMDVNTTAQAADNTEVKVDGVENYFNGDYYIGHSKTQDFIIRGKQTKNMLLSSTSQSSIQVATGGKIELNGTLKYDNDSAFVNPGAEVYLTVNGDAKGAINVPISSSGDNKSLDISEAISKELTQEFDDDKFNDGDNTVTIYSRDSLGNKSNTLTFTIKVLGKTANLVLDPNGYSFDDMQAIQRGLIHRKGTWKVNVYSVNSGWSLNASATSMTYTSDFDKSTHTFDGEMVYVKDKVPLPMINQVPIDSSTDDTGTTTTVIGSNWSNDDGILLKSNGGTDVSGKYKGVINWDLVQAP